jgi:hypothetical protein
MSALSLIVDGMLSGTGIRDAVAGGYLEPEEIGVSKSLRSQIDLWLERYEDAHFHQYENHLVNEALDSEGLEIARKLSAELPSANVRYYSNAKLQEIKF